MAHLLMPRKDVCVWSWPQGFLAEVSGRLRLPAQNNPEQWLDFSVRASQPITVAGQRKSLTSLPL